MNTQKTLEEALPKDYQAALAELYSKYGKDQTDEQKLNILINELGDCYVSAMGDYAWTDEERRALKIRVMELEYLEHAGIHNPSLM